MGPIYASGIGFTTWAILEDWDHIDYAIESFLHPEKS
jgi:hypothetical protein